jgi:hypothetical protein
MGPSLAVEGRPVHSKKVKQKSWRWMIGQEERERSAAKQ